MTIKSLNLRAELHCLETVIVSSFPKIFDGISSALYNPTNQKPSHVRLLAYFYLKITDPKICLAIPNLHSIQTISSVKGADAINKALPPERESAPLNVLLQVNTSGEDAKSGLPPLSPPESPASGQTEVTGNTESTEPGSPLVELAKHIIFKCPRLRLQGLMAIGALSESVSDSDINRDFETLKATRDALDRQLRSLADTKDKPVVPWGESGHLVLSMGMSSDFEAALKAGSDIVRVGTGIFGQRPKKETTP